MRTAVFVLALGSPFFFSACSLPRDAIGTSTIDGAIGPLDAFVARDAGIDAPGLDAYVVADAFVPPDGFVLPPDAYMPSDAYVAPDAWTDPCGPGAPDADHDGVADACDRCPGHDDHVDVDADGMPDGCDSWPCGATAPAAPAASVTVGSATVSGVSIAAMGTVVVVDPSASVGVGVTYTISECGCMSCIDQIEIGWSPGSRQFCAYDGNPDCRAVSSGTSMQSAMTPAAHGQYELRFHLAQDYACGRSSADWYGGAPSDGTIAYVCVR